MLCFLRFDFDFSTFFSRFAVPFDFSWHFDFSLFCVLFDFSMQWLTFQDFLPFDFSDFLVFRAKSLFFVNNFSTFRVGFSRAVWHTPFVRARSRSHTQCKSWGRCLA